MVSQLSARPVDPLGPIWPAFEAARDAAPDAPALLGDGRQLTYREFSDAAERVAAHLVELGVEQGDFVGLLASRSVDAVIAMFGALRAGAAYVPLDPTHAPEQLPFIARDLPIKVTLVADRWADCVADALPENVARMSLDKALRGATRTPRLWPTPQADDVAYVMYTSGTTGQPKGVVVPQAGITAFAYRQPMLDVQPDDVVLHANTIACDGSAFDIFAPLLNGAACAVAEMPFPATDELARVFTTHRVTMAMLYAGVCNLMIDHQLAVLGTARMIYSVGDVISIPHARKLLDAYPGMILQNFYGPTEVTCITLGCRITREMLDGRPLPIGRCLDRKEAFVVDDNLIPLPDGARGQLVLGGCGVAAGYYNQPERTGAAFIPDPRPGHDGTAYLTGDLVEMRADGLYDFHGRVDRQVKLGGRRIELDGIEHVLRQQPGVADAVVMVVKDRGGDRKIGALIQPVDPQADDDALIRAILAAAKESLHPASLPKILRVTSDWHLTPAGKVNRRAMLPQLEAAAAMTDSPAIATTAARPDVKALVAKVWQDILGYSPIPEDLTFFEAGGSSMQLIDAHSRIEARLGRHFDITLLFEAPRLADLSARLASLAPAPEAAQPKAAADTGRDIAIIGLAGRYPGAPTLETFWQHLRRGDNLIPRYSPDEMEDSFTPEERRSPHYVPARPILDHADAFDAKFFGILPREAERMDPQARVFLEICSEALDDAAIDPARAKTRIGVWAGSSMSTYMLRNLMADRDGLNAFTSGYQISDYATLTGNLPDSLATRVAWKLDLKGPAMTVQTACSTSLTAIAQAVTALRGGLADIALAGGVSITFPQKRGYFAQEGGMGSTDGLCRPFDADASGTVFGHGAGVVVLKRLADAQAAGDRILAVIKGVGLSNDGADKISYTAPSVTGQAEAIRAAIRDAAVDPASVSYVECHGTATPLGDPIEVAGLNQAFAGTPKGQVTLGSVKGNIGHLDAAAGVMGVIKTTLMLQAREIPPVANFRSPNPRIDFASSPFCVAATLQPWESAGLRRAGVSAFGVGGTNVHLVLEEAPETPAVPAVEVPQILPLSAASPEALAAYATRLADRLTAPDAPSLADAAFTLQEGRRRFGYRLAIAARTTAEAAEKLLTARMPDAAAPSQAPKVVFMFPGQGSQYPGMGRGLYAAEPVYAGVIDMGVEILKPLIDTDLARILCDADVSDEDAAQALRETRLTQPALFLTEVATARLWQARGVVPDAMIGHSVGEFAAAVVAGVMSFEDALRIIAERGRLMQSQPSGAMLSVRATVEALAPFLGDGAELAACNAPNLQVVAGPDAAITALTDRLKAAGIAVSRLHTSHAFHSAMMDAVVPALHNIVRGMTLNAPALPIISSVTGQRMTAEQAQDPVYWAAQARATVNFQAALQTAADEFSETGAPAFIEVGAGRTLSAFAGQTLKRGGHGGIIQSLPDHTQTGVDDSTVMAAAFANLWAAGAEVDLARLPRGARRVALPPHPFLRKRHWVEPAETPESRPASAMMAASAQPVSSLKEPPLPQEAKMTIADRKPRLTTALLALFGNISGDDLTEADAGTPFLELGFDSLFMAQAATALTKDYGVEVPFRAMLTDYPSVTALAEYLDGILPADPQETTAATPVQVTAPTTPAPVTQAPAAAPGPVSGDLAGVLQAQMATMQAVFAEQLRALGAPVAQPVAQSAPAQAAPVAAQPTMATPPAAKPAEAKAEGGFKVGRGPSVSGAVLTDPQKAFVADLTRRYSSRHAKSKAYTERYRDALADPRTAAGFHPDWKELTFPIVADRSKGAHIWDVDGNRFVDVVNGFGQTAFGHSPDFVSDAVVKQLEKGYAIGPQADQAGPIAERLAKYLGHDRVTFCNTGSEAVMAAMRLARAVTGRERVVVFSNDYHGQFDEVLVRGRARGGEPAALPIAPGIPRSGLTNMTVLTYGAPESLDWIRANIADIAAVIVEPIQSRHPELQPKEFVHDLREVTRAAGTALVIDEVVTGFRTHPRGMQAVWGVEADMATYGKVVGGGMPIGLLAGNRRFMDALDGGAWHFGDASKPEVAPTFFAGTFVRHPVALAAIDAVLDHMDGPGRALWEDVPTRAADLAGRMNTFLAGRGLPKFVTHYNGWFVINATAQDPRATLLFALMRLEGVHILDGYCGFLTTVHSAEDIELIFTAFAKGIDTLQSVGILGGTRQPLQAAEPPRKAIPLTESQTEIWLTHQLGDTAACAFNEGVTLRLDGPLDAAALEGALTALIARHDALRMVFDRAGKTFNVIDTFTPDLPRVDLDDAADPDAALARAIADDAATAFDLTAEPPVRFTLVRLADTAHVLLLTAHHIAVDGMSYWLILKDLAALYAARVAGRADALPAAASFAAVAAEAPAEPNEKALAYWTAQYDTIPALPDLPTDHPRPAVKSFNGATVTEAIDADEMKAIRKAGAKLGCTLFSTLFAGLQITLGKLSGARDVVIGVPSAGQTLLADPNVVGHFVNLLPIRAAFDPAEPAAAHLKRVGDKVMEAFDHQGLTFGTLIRALAVPRALARMPLTEVQFNLERATEGVDAAGVTFSPAPSPKAASNFDMFINVTESRKGLRLDVDYNADVYDAATVRRWIGHYRTVLAALAADTETRITDLPLIPQTADESDAPALAFDRSAMVQDLVARGAALNPDSLAVEATDARLTHAELAAASDALAAHIQSHLPDPGARIAVALPRGAGMLVALLAVWKAGHSYIPLDPRQPAARLQSIVETAEAAAVIATEAPFAPILPLIRPEEATPRAKAAPVAADPEQAAYVIFTSGSTGTPKGVAVPHRAVVNFLTSMAQEPGLTAHDCLLAVTTVSFDIAVLELFLPLSVGAKVVIASTEEVRDCFPLVERLKQGDITALQATPTLWGMLLDAGFTPRPSLTMLCGGEPLPTDLAGKLTAGGGPLWNLYGPTETTIWSAIKKVEPDAPITIGHPIGNTNLHVLSDDGQVLPIGAVGELNISGAGLALGYLNRPDLTDAAFRDVALNGKARRLYRTGDLAKRLPNGEVAVLGRIDGQVKLRGFRIELGEIEATLRAQPGVAKAAVDLREDVRGDKRLIGWIVPEPGMEPDFQALARALAVSLPDYMIPQGWMQLDALPQTANGKLDRKALPAPEHAAVSATAIVAPETETERQITIIWAEVLGQETVGVTATIQSLGVDSLSVFRIAARMLDAGLGLEARDMLRHPTIRDLAAYADQRARGTEDRAVRPSLKSFRGGARRGMRAAS